MNGTMWELAQDYKTLGNSSILKLKFIFNYVQKVSFSWSYIEEKMKMKGPLRNIIPCEQSCCE